MEQTRALNALEPFLALSKHANSPRAAADLITQATSAPNTYVFAELLQTPNIQSLRGSEEYASHLTLLEIFAWGTWGDYKAHGNLPTLSQAQQQKLLLLSLLPLSQSHDTLTYPALMRELDLPSPRALDELVTKAIYSGLITGALDPANQRLSVTSVSPLRDLAPGSIPNLQSALVAWSARCDDALAELEAQVAVVKRGAVQREKERLKKAEAMSWWKEQYEHGHLHAKQEGKRGWDSSELMDVDENSLSGVRTRGMKRGGGGGGSFLGMG